VAYLPKGYVALERALSKLGVASRTQARQWIEAGRISVDSRTIRDPLHPIIPEKARIFLDNEPIVREEKRIIALHKPRGCVTTAHDPQGRPTVYSYLTDLPLHMVPVGRLDFATSGLLLLTNDTQLANRLTDPRSGVVRTYVVVLRGEVDDAALQTWRDGVDDAGERLQVVDVALRKRSGRETTVIVQLVEGKNREIRRLAVSVGSEVLKLKRIAYGGVTLGELPVGQWRDVAPDEL
jgi:23S rRNA pseudouridine2605 synthase